MYRTIALLLGGLILLSTNTLDAQNAVLSETYGSGVHAYFSRDYDQAFTHFNAAVEQGSQDPRCFYFRGLANLQLGRPDEARQDFQSGAQYEATDTNNFYNVGRSLERIQGKRRLIVEKFRASARQAALERANVERKARYEEFRQEQSRVLREQAEAAPAEPVEPPAPPAAEGEDVFGAEPVEEPAEEPVEKPAEMPAEEAAEEPAGEAAKEPAEEAAEEPAEEAAEEPAEEAAEEPAEKADKEDPFADEEPAGKDKEAKPVEEEDAELPLPDEEEKPAADDDASAKEKKPAADKEDPFKEEDAEPPAPGEKKKGVDRDNPFAE